jgi:hypothetical protein
MTTPTPDGRPWNWDKEGMTRRIMETATDVVEGLTEAIQNAIDSSIPPREPGIPEITEEEIKALPNEIEIKIAEEDFHGDLMFVIQDRGLSIAKDYDWDIIKFLNAEKGTSAKKGNPDAIGWKGVGMFNYLSLADKIEVVSQDSDHRGCIYRFWIRWVIDTDGKKVPGWSWEIEYEAISSESQKKFGIYEQGTQLRFYGPTEAAKEMMKEGQDKIIERIKDSFGLKMARNPNLTIYWMSMRQGAVPSSRKKLGLPDYLKVHPEKHIAWVETRGKDLETTIFEITGNLYEDKRGSSRINVIGQGGQLVIKEHGFSPPRQVAGWLACNKWIPETGRKGVIRDKNWKASLSVIGEILLRYRKVRYPDEDESDRKTDTSFKNYISKAFAEILPKAVITGANLQKPIKTLQKGKYKPLIAETIGPGTRPTKVPDPKRVINNRKQHIRDNTNQHQVGMAGEEDVMRAGQEPNNRQTRQPPLDFQKGPYGAEYPLLDLYFEENPWTVCINTDHPLYHHKYKIRGTERKHRLAEEVAMMLMKHAQYEGKIPNDKDLTFVDFRKYLEKYTVQVLNQEDEP